MTMIHMHTMHNLSVEDPLADAELTGAGYYNLPDMLPLKVKRERNELFFENSKIGNIIFHSDKRELRISLRVDDKLPRAVAQTIANNMRPFLLLVLTQNDMHLRRTEAVERNMIELMGPPDGNQVKIDTAISSNLLYDLLNPSIFRRVLPQQFSWSWQKGESRYDYDCCFYYKENDIRHLAFKIRDTGRSAHHGDYDVHPGTLRILGRGNREKARLGFVSDLLRNVEQLARQTVENPRFVEDMARLRAAIPVNMAEHRNERGRQIGGLSFFKSGKKAYPGDGEHFTCDLSNNFTLRLQYHHKNSTPYGYDMEIIHDDVIVLSNHSGLLSTINVHDGFVLQKLAFTALHKIGMPVANYNQSYIQHNLDIDGHVFVKHEVFDNAEQDMGIREVIAYYS